MPLPRTLTAAIALAILFAPAPLLAAGTISFDNIRVRDGWLEIDLRVEGALSPEVRESLEKGLPTTVTYVVELWRSRSRWFDRLEATRYVEFRVEHDAWTGTYRVKSAEGESWEIADFAPLEGLVLRPAAIRVSPIARISGRSAHYFSVSARVRPLELEQIREIEDWLEGKIPGEEEGKKSGGVLGMPERVFGFVAGIAGFGEETVEAKSISFRPESLE